MEPESPFTHVLWVRLHERGKFRGWWKAGYGRIEIDGDGRISAHNFQYVTNIGGWNGYTLLLPIGEDPPDPQMQPKRPQTTDEHGDEADG